MAPLGPRALFQLKMGMKIIHNPSGRSPISVEEEVAILDWKLESGLPAGTEAEVQCWARN